MLHVNPARNEANSRFGEEELLWASQREAPVGSVVSIGGDASQKHALRGRFFATSPNYNSTEATNQSGRNHIHQDFI